MNNLTGNTDYLNQMNTILAQILNSNSSLSCLIELRAKLGLPLYYCSFHNPIHTMNILTCLLRNAQYSNQYSIILVASACFCYQYVPRSERKKVLIDLEQCLPMHTVSDYEDQTSSFCTFLQTGGAQLIPCKPQVLSRIVNHKDTRVSTSPKLIGPILAEDPKKLAPLLYISRDTTKLSISDLFLFGQLHNSISLPEPTDRNLIDSLLVLCESILMSDYSFFEAESALSCLSMLVSWGIIEPKDYLLKIENQSLKVLAHNCFAQYISREGIEKLPSFPNTNDPMIMTSYLRMICSALNRDSADISGVKIPHWIVNAIKLEFDYADIPIECILSSPCIYELSSEDLSLISSIYDYIPSWVFIHILRIRTTSAVVLQCCMNIIQQAPKCIIEHFFDDYLNFISGCIIVPECINDLVQMIKNMAPVLSPRVSQLFTKIIHDVDILDSSSLLTKLKIINTIIDFTSDSLPFLSIFDLIMEGFDSFVLSPSFLDSLLVFFSKIIIYRRSFHHELMLISLSVAASPFYSNHPEFLTQRRHVSIFHQCQLFFSVVDSDIVANPLFTPSNAFPPLSSAILLMSHLTHYDRTIEDFLVDLLTKSLSLCPFETTLAAAIISPSLRSPITHKIRKITKTCDRACFNIAASQLTQKIPKNLITFSSLDDVRYLIEQNPEFIPLLSHYPQYFYLLFEVKSPRIDSTAILMLIESTKNITPIVRRIAQKFGVQQPSIKKQTWSEFEFGDSVSESQVIHKFNSFKCYSIYKLPKSIDDPLSSFRIFRILFPIIHSSQGFLTDLIFAMKKYRKWPLCREFLQLFFANLSSDIIQTHGPSLWILELGYPFTANIDIQSHTERSALFSIRQASYKGEIDSENTQFIESIKSGHNESISIGTTLSFLYDSKNNTFLKPNIECPSFHIRIIRKIANMLSPDSSSIVSQLSESPKEYISSFIALLDLRNPIVVQETIQTLMLISDSSQLQFKSYFINNYIVQLFKDTTVSSASIWQAFPILNEASKILSHFDSGKSMIRKFHSMCSQANIGFPN